MSDRPVLIVGAGPTGLVLAIELARRGVPFHLIDRHPQPLGRDRAVAVKSRTLEILQSLGLADPSFSAGAFSAASISSRAGRRWRPSRSMVSTARFRSLCIPEDETERILTERLT